MNELSPAQKRGVGNICIAHSALEALSEEERIAADAHRADCPKCTKTLQQLRAFVDLFPLSVPAIDPPPRVKEHILARIQQDPLSRALKTT